MQNHITQTGWTLALLNAIEWKRFEELCTRMFEHKGFVCKTQNLGSDEGIDIHLYFGKAKLTLDRIVHCKTSEKKVGVALMRDFYATMQTAQAKRGTFVSRGGFTEDAKATAAAHGIHTIDGPQLLQLITELQPLETQRLLEHIAHGDYITPTCPQCGVKLLPRSLVSDKPYWSCENWKPHGKGCLTRIYINSAQLTTLKALKTAPAT